MKRTMIFALLFSAAVVQANAIVDFQDKTLSPNSYYNGSDGANGFTSRGASFNNNYNTTYYSWDGWACSNTTDTTHGSYTNQFSAITGGGSDTNGAVVDGGNYAVAYPGFVTPPTINLPGGETPVSVRITNTTYTGLTILNGDPYGFSKKFGGDSGNDPDYFSVTFIGHAGADGNGATTGVTTFFLADYRFVDNAQDYIVKDWKLVDLSGLGAAHSITLSFDSSDSGSYGINTPTYAAIDNLTSVPEPASLGLLGLGSALLLRRRGACNRR